MDLETYLTAYIGKNLVKSHGKSTGQFIRTQALDKMFFECKRRMWRFTERNLIDGIVWDGGSDWIILSRNFSHYLVYGEDELLLNLKLYYRYTLLPAEVCLSF